MRPFEYLDMPILIIASAKCMCACNAHAHHDVTRFTYDVNHITKMSPMSVFQLCHEGMRWHDVIDVHVV